MWTRGCSRSNVWIADVRPLAGGLILHDLVRVQQLPGSEPPFKRLASLLGGGDFRAAGIDAPFSLPGEFVQRVGGHDELLDLVGANVPPDRHFQKGAAFVELVTGLPPPLNPKKPLRETEKWWQTLKVNIRSTLWVTPRGGAPMTAACLSLLHMAERPLWPWSSGESGLLAEAFPAGQLQSWNSPFAGYNGGTAPAAAKRTKILQVLSQRIQLGTWLGPMKASADALDAVVCALAVIAPCAPPSTVSTLAQLEGWIATSP
jgi:hypothetical protein